MIFLLKCDGAKVATYVPPLQRIRSSRSSTDIFGCLNFGLDRLSSFQSSRLSHTLSFALLLHRPPFRVFNLPSTFSHALFLLALLLGRLPFQVFDLPSYIYFLVFVFFFLVFFVF